MKKCPPRCKCAFVALKHICCLTAFIVGCLPPALFPQSFTIQQALSAPFAQDLCAAPARGRIAWVANIDGRRNIWVAESDATGKGYTSRQLTHYSEDDGQELNDLGWTADAATIVYVRGDSAQGVVHPVPNPASSPLGRSNKSGRSAPKGENHGSSRTEILRWWHRMARRWHIWCKARSGLFRWRLMRNLSRFSRCAARHGDCAGLRMARDLRL